jgi:hypothetical protein
LSDLNRSTAKSTKARTFAVALRASMYTTLIGIGGGSKARLCGPFHALTL